MFLIRLALAKFDASFAELADAKHGLVCACGKMIRQNRAFQLQQVLLFMLPTVPEREGFVSLDGEMTEMYCILAGSLASRLLRSLLRVFSQEDVSGEWSHRKELLNGDSSATIEDEYAVTSGSSR